MAKTIKTQNQLDLVKEILDISYQDFSTILTEDNVASGNKSFKMERKILSKNKNYLLFRYDPNKINMFPYFSSTSGLKKICDYIMFVEDSKNLFILLIELKLGTESASKQLSASESFVNFILDSANRIGLKLTNINVKKVRISEERANRKKRSKCRTKHKEIKMDENNIYNYDYLDNFRLDMFLNL